MAVAPALQNVVTLKEWPCLEEDLSGPQGVGFRDLGV